MFEVRCDLHEQLEPFRSNGWFQVAESREVAARMRKAINNTLSHRFGDDREYDGDGAGRLFQRLCGRGAGAYDHIWCKSENVPSRALRPFDVKDTPVVVDYGHPTEPLQTLLEHPGAIECI